MKNEVILSHQAPVGTDDFLVELIVLRCKLLFEMGYVDSVLASLQALTEFHFFTKIVDIKRITLQDLFLSFWKSGCKRIGDNGAKGNRLI